MESTPSTKSSFSDEIQSTNEAVKKDPSQMENILQILVDIYNSVNKSSLLMINISKLNKACLKTPLQNEKEETIMKYTCIIIVPLTFFSLD